MSYSIQVDRENIRHTSASDELLASRILPYGVDPDRVVAVHVEEYRSFQFGPEGTYTVRDDDGSEYTYWVTFPGGFRHSGRMR